MKKIFSKFNGFIIDLDGVIYLERKLLPFTKEFIDLLHKNKKKYVFLTNDSSVSPEEYSKILKKIGIKCDKRQVITPISNFINIVTTNFLEKKGIMIFASKKLKDFLKKQKIKTISDVSRFKDPENILVSGNIDFNYRDLMYASLCVQNGANLYATSVDNSYPTKLGNVPATGSIIAAITKTFPTKVINLGKPTRKIFMLAVQKLGLPKSEILTIGDNLKTDIAGANSVGIKSALVLTGKTNAQMVKESKIDPTYIIKNLKI